MRRCRGLLRRCSRLRGCFSNWRNSNDGCLNGDLFFTRSRSCGRLHDHARRRWRHNNNWARGGRSPCGSLGDNCARGRTRGNRWSGRRSSDNRRRRARLRNDPAWFRPGWGWGGGGLCGNRRSGGRRSRRRFSRDPRVTRLFFLFLLLGQKGLHHIARLGDVRKIDLGDDGFRAMTARRNASMRRSAPRFPHKVRTNLLRLVQLQRAAVRLAAGNAEFRKNVENRPRLDFQLFCEIVDTNLTHPPLFSLCRQKAP